MEILEIINKEVKKDIANLHQVIKEQITIVIWLQIHTNKNNIIKININWKFNKFILLESIINQFSRILKKANAQTFL